MAVGSSYEQGYAIGFTAGRVARADGDFDQKLAEAESAARDSGIPLGFAAGYAFGFERGGSGPGRHTPSPVQAMPETLHGSAAAAARSAYPAAAASVLPTLQEATALEAARVAAYSTTLCKWGRTSPVTHAAFQAREAAKTLATLLRCGSTNVSAVAKAHSDFERLSKEADRQLVEGPPRVQSPSRDYAAEKAEYDALMADIDASNAESRRLAAENENYVETTTRTVIRV